MSANLDVCVVGGGPAGLAAAIALRMRGFSVMLMDCAVPPIDKTCGEGLLPDSIAGLQELGVAIPSGVGFRFRGVQFTEGDCSVAADFPNGRGIGLRRTVLHNLLVERAQEVGVSLLWGANRIRLEEGGIVVDEKRIEPQLVLAADGQNSRIRRHAGLDQRKPELQRFGFRRHYRVRPWSAYMELYWGKRCQIYITPLSESEICVALLSRDPKLRLDEALRHFPGIMNRLESAEPSSVQTGALTVSRKLRAVCRPGFAGPALALIGDASGSVDAITGEGLGLSFRQAVALARAFRAGKLSSYAKAHQVLSRRPRFMGALLLRLGEHERLRRRVLETLARHPDIFARLLAIHVGEYRSSGARRIPSPISQ
ncbi:MAG: NAD(P)/FAD-dependent oxidoreductase [Bryobacteraceae bacterium]